MLLPINSIDADSPRFVLGLAKSFIISRVGAEKFFALNLANPLDTEIDLLDTLRAYRDVVASIEIDHNIVADIAAAIEAEEYNDWRNEQDEKYYTALYDAYDRRY